MATLENVSEWRGREMFDRHGDKIGKIDSIYVDQGSGRAEWALVNTGLFGMRSTWVPIGEAVSEPHGVRVPVEKATVKGAPSMDPDSEMSRDEEVELFRYYGLSYDDHGADAQGHDHHEEHSVARRTEPWASLDDRPPESRERYREGDRRRSQEPETLAGQPAVHHDEQSPTRVHQDAPGQDEAPVHQEAPPVHQEAPVHQERPAAHAGEPAADSRAGRGVPYADWGLDEPQPPASEAPVGHAARPPEHGYPEQDVPVEHNRPESHERQPDDQRAHGHESDAYREDPAAPPVEGHSDPPAPRPEPGAGADREGGEQGSGRHPRLERGVDRVATRLKRLI